MFSKSITWYHVILTGLVFVGVVFLFLIVFNYSPENIKHLLRDEWISLDTDPTPRFRRAISVRSTSFVDTTMSYSLYSLLSIIFTFVIVYGINRFWPHKPATKKGIHKTLTSSQLVAVIIIGVILAYAVPQLLANVLIGPMNTKLY